MNADERAIRELVMKWMVASEAGDLDTVLGLMTDDVVFMVPGRAPFGKDVFADAARKMKDVRMQGTTDIKEIECSAPGVAILTYEAHATRANRRDYRAPGARQLRLRQAKRIVENGVPSADAPRSLRRLPRDTDRQ